MMPVSGFFTISELVLFFYTLKYYVLLQWDVLQLRAAKHIMLFIYAVLAIFNLIIMQIVFVFVPHLAE